MAINLTWKFENGKHALYRQGSKVPVLSVVPDQTYPGMWRIQSKDGKLSDMTNLSRARDAATSMAMAEYDRQTRVERPAEARGSRLPEVPASHPAPKPINGPATVSLSSL